MCMQREEQEGNISGLSLTCFISLTGGKMNLADNWRSRVLLFSVLLLFHHSFYGMVARSDWLEFLCRYWEPLDVGTVWAVNAA